MTHHRGAGRDACRWTVIALSALLSLGCEAERAGGSDAVGDRGAEATLSPEAPALSAVTLDGDSVSLADLRGAPVLLNVWATWCAPCRQEIPELQALHEKHAGDGLRVIGVTVDARSAGEDVRAFIDEFGMTYETWWDPDQTSVSAFRAAGVPLTVLIGPDGRIRWRHLGVLRPGDPSLRDAIEALL